jgi:hypothetical protein
VRHPDRRTARDRVKVTTTGLALGSAVGVVAVAGGLAVQAQSAASPATVKADNPKPSTTTPGHAPAQTRPAQRSATPKRVVVSAPRSQPHAQSSGS